MNKNLMLINRENAMRLWTKRFGKAVKVTDFAGRKMVKSAYDDRNSEFGWNIDHICPQSHGGVSSEFNLICCHILTNDEKADKFPCFVANERKFEIVKVENHYEIKQLTGESNEEDDLNFFDYSNAIRFYKSLKGIQNKKRFVGTIVIRLNGLENTALLDFIRELFDSEEFEYDKNNVWYNSKDDAKLILHNYDMPSKEDTQSLLDKCILLNTYLEFYFAPLGVVDDYSIFYGVHNFDGKLDNLIAENDFNNNTYNTFNNKKCRMYINELVKINTDAAEDLENVNSYAYDKLRYNVYQYDFTYIKLRESLEKEVNR